VLCASVLSKSGRILLARAFAEISRQRLEGYLQSFPKLVNNDSAHTFIETDSIRYVYQVRNHVAHADKTDTLCQCSRTVWRYSLLSSTDLLSPTALCAKVHDASRRSLCNRADVVLSPADLVCVHSRWRRCMCF